MRIAFIDSWLQSAVEGSGTAVGIGGLEQALRVRGHQIDRIAPPGDGIWPRLPITLRRLLFNAVLPQHLDPRAYDLVVGFDIDGVWLRTSGQQADRQAGTPAARRPSATAYVCSVKGVIAEEALQEQGRIRWLFTALARLEGRNTRRADRVVTTSAYCRDRIVQHYGTSPQRIGIVPEGIDVAAWRTAIEAAPPRADLRPTILCVARHYPRKRITDLIAAFAHVRRWLPGARLRIVGDGPERARLEAQTAALGLRDSVTFLGGIPDDEVRREYAHADVFCLPSQQEGFGIVFLEAMVAGLPIVSTTAAAIPEVVRHGETGILVPRQDPHSLAGALITLLGDADRRAQMGSAARRRVLQYDWQRVAEIFLEHVAPLIIKED